MNNLFNGLTITDHAKTAQNEIVKHLRGYEKIKREREAEPTVLELVRGG